jgi:hypothetical protein
MPLYCAMLVCWPQLVSLGRSAQAPLWPQLVLRMCPSSCRCAVLCYGVLWCCCSWCYWRDLLSATVAAAGFAGERKVPLISPASSSPQLTGMPFFRRTVPSDRWVGAGVARTMRLLCAHCMYAMCTPSCGTHAYASHMQCVISCGADESVHTALTLNILDSPTSPAAVFALLQVLPTTVASCTPPPLKYTP